MLPDIDKIPIEETFRKCAAGILDVMLAISAAQQLWQAQKFDQAVLLLRLWLKKHDSSHKYVVLFNISVYLENMGSLQEAEIYMRHVLYLQPLFLQGHLQLALLLEKIGRRDEAAAQLLHSISLPLGNDPQNSTLRNTIIHNVIRLARGFSNL
jgi:tetratricopeptide (TPR) repeat protein